MDKIHTKLKERKEKKDKKGTKKEGKKDKSGSSSTKRTSSVPKTKRAIELRPEFSVLNEHDIHYDRSGFLGDGMYGKVYRGECFSKPVAIKELNVNEKDYQSKEEYESDMECLVTEINIMMKNSHPNIMTLIGVCPKTKDGKTLIVMELEDGDLFHLLISDQGRPTAVAQTMTLFDRLKLIKEGALGMEFLHSIEPAIIHRDLKLENLMYKRIDNTIQVRLSDFGLSAIKPKSVKKLTSDGRGNNLTKAPEVVLGRDFDEKADVYSYSMCMWEILHCVPLYPEIQSSQELFEKVVRKGMRPQLSPTVPTSLRLLLERMWDADPTHRPNFSEINKSLDEVLIDAAVTDKRGRKFWKDHFLKDHTPSWPKFVEAFYGVLGVQLVRPTLPYATNQEDIKYHCLRALLVVDKKESKDGQVRIQDFGFVLGWLSGMDDKGSETILDRAVKLLTQPWFHGDIERNAAQRRLEGQAEGSFLVRFSKSTPGGYAITKLEQIIRNPGGQVSGGMDKSQDGDDHDESGGVNKLAKVNYVMKNYSISQTEEGFTFQIAGAQVNSTDTVVFPDVVSLIDHFRDKIGLKEDCPGSRFRAIVADDGLGGTAYDSFAI